jgi:TetR/AcrR family transcriptional regulator, tetracycline repressor protein
MTQKRPTKPRRPKGRAPVTADKVLAMALDIVERDGVDALTIRRLAADLGVGTPSVYWHVGNRNELLDRLIEEINEQLGNVQPRGRTPAERISSIMRSLLAEVRARPHLIALSATQGRGEAIFTKAQEVLAHELTAAGLHGEDAAFAFSTILFHFGGFALLEHAVSHDYRIHGVDHWARADAGSDDDIDEAMRARLRKDADLDEIYEFTLDTIVRALLGERPGRAPTPGRRSGASTSKR